MHRKARTPSSALRPSEACAAELIAGGSKIAIPSKQPLGELTQDPLKEANLKLHGWRPAGSQHNHLVFEHAVSGIRIHDVHAGNFIRRKNGDLIPIDVFFESIPQS